jgi:Zn-dependent M28 family amino/carboxypeptidase
MMRSPGRVVLVGVKGHQKVRRKTSDVLLAISLSVAAASFLRLTPGALSAVAADSLPGLVEDATRLNQPSNTARLEALQALLRSRHLNFELQPFANDRRARDSREQGQNVVVTTGSGRRDLIVGAHFDAVALADGSLSGGMVDNAASVVALMRVAESLGGHQLRHRVRVVFFDMEEIGQPGSRYFAQSMDRAGVAAMVNLDIAGYGDTVFAGPAANAGNAAVYDALRRVCARDRRVCIESAAFPQSDDRSFQAAGTPNVSLGIVPRLEVHQMWLLLNGGRESGLAADFRPAILRTIHTAEDRASRLDAAAMTLAHDVVTALILELDATME